MPEITEQAPLEATGLAMAGNVTVVAAFADATFTPANSADFPVTRTLRVTVDGVDYLIAAKLAP